MLRVKVLGCYGGELPNFKSTSFLINDHILLDAGAVTSVLSLKEQMKIDTIIITHSHFDHIKDIFFLADNIVSRNSRSVKLVTNNNNIKIIKRHLLNNVIWPDFSIIPSKKSPVYKLVAINEGTRLNLVGNISIIPISVSHTVDTMGYLVSDGQSSIIFSSDTGPTHKLWQRANSTKNLKAIFIETSYPNSMKKFAEISRHFTPSMLIKELGKLKKSELDIFVYHMKPLYLKKIISEFKKEGRKNIRILKQEMILRF
ncbi:MAG TPA: 3',5'-cyclic-nucleotide phosphodiesterase [bacterium]